MTTFFIFKAFFKTTYLLALMVYLSHYDLDKKHFPMKHYYHGEFEGDPFDDLKNQYTIFSLDFIAVEYISMYSSNPLHITKHSSTQIIASTTLRMLCCIYIDDTGHDTREFSVFGKFYYRKIYEEILRDRK
ncbi:hypothetical protein ACJX0J_034858 [Zea mays]